MTRPSLAGIEKRANAATEGPWFQGRNGRPHESTRDVYSKREPHEPDSHDIATYMHSDEDAAFIADARTAVPALTAAVRDVLAALTPHWDAQVRREAKFGRSGSACVCEVCDAVRALATHLDLTDTEGDPT